MSSKFPSKREKPHTTKPYDRPKSFFQRVTNSVAAVADYLPSWLNPSGWSLGGATVAEQDRPTNEIDEETEEETEEYCDVTALPATGRSSQRSEGEASVSTASFTRSPLKRNNPETPPLQQALANGDDHSDNSETSASTSGCSSLAPSQEKKRGSVGGSSATQLRGLQVSQRHLKNLKQQLGASAAFSTQAKLLDEPSTSKALTPAVAPPKVRIDVSIPRHLGQRSRKSVAVGGDTPMDKNQEKDADSSSTRTSLWSEEDERNSLMGKRTRTARPQPMAPSKRPCFSPSAFASPLRSSRNQSLVGPEDRSSLFSPFYQGQTTYGGASAYKKARMGSLYNSTLRAEVMKVRQSGSQEVLSSAAQKVLNVLENMSTPLTDAKKIPVEHVSTDFALSYTPSIFARRPLRLDSSATPFTMSAGPPRTSFPLQNSGPRLRPSTILDSLAQASSRPETKSTSPSRGHGGKVRTKVSHSERLSIRNQNLDEEEPLPELDLPQVALPAITSLPSFSFRVPGCTSTPIIANPATSITKGVALPFEGATPSSVPSLGFTFSSPIENKPPEERAKGDSSEEMETTFKFRSPVFQSGSPATKPLGSVSLSPPNPPTVTFNFSAPASSGESVSPLRRKAPVVEDSAKSSPFGAAPELIVGGSVMDILGKPAAEKVTSAPKETLEKPPPAAKGFGSAFQLKGSEWDCSVCLVRNKSSISLCVACTTARPGNKDQSAPVQPPTKSTSSSGFGSKFAAQPGSWCCPTCMVNNTESADSCVACTESRPGGKLATTGSTQAPSKTSPAKVAASSLPASIPQKWVGTPVKSAGGWECDTCLVRNKDGTARCCACETPRLKTPSIDIKDKFTGFKFGQQSETSVGSSPMKFGFGNQTTSAMNKDASQSTTGFKFGLPLSSDTSEAKVSEGFKFGAPVATNAAASGFGVQPSQVHGTFKFGLASEASKPDAKSAPETQGNKSDVAKSAAKSVTDKSVASEGKSTSGQEKFVFGQSSVTEAKTEVTATLTFGQKAIETTPATTSGFSFGKTVPDSTVAVKSDAGVKENAPATSVAKDLFSFGSSTAHPTETVLVTSSANVDTNSGGFKYSFPSAVDSQQTPKNNGETSETSSTVPAFSFGSQPKSQENVSESVSTTSTPSGFQFTFSGGKEPTGTGAPALKSGPAMTAFSSTTTGANSNPAVTAPSMPVFSVVSTSTAPKAVANFGVAPQAGTLGGPAVASTVASSPVPTGGFVFGSAKPAQAAPVAAATGGFSFGFGGPTAVATKPVGATTPFSFGNAPTSAAPSVNSNTGFSFTAKPSPANVTGMMQEPSVTASSVFSFGAGNTGKPLTTVASPFGASPAQKPVFGVFSPAPPVAPSFSQQQVNVPPASEPFRFGASNVTGGNAVSSVFQFGGAKPPAVASSNNNNNSSNPGGAVFRFGAQDNSSNQQQQQQPLFGGAPQVAPPGGAFTFGASAAPMGDGGGAFPPANPDTSPFVFGAVPAPAPQNPNPMAAQTPFQFQAANPTSNPFNATPTATPGPGARPIRKAIRRVGKKK